jgi:hypothetical protein
MNPVSPERRHASRKCQPASHGETALSVPAGTLTLSLAYRALDAQGVFTRPFPVC